jgi:hypothetical protein
MVVTGSSPAPSANAPGSDGPGSNLPDANVAGSKSTSTKRHRRSREIEEDRPGLIGRWLRSDPIRAVALGLILVQLLVRADVAAGGFLTVDDFMLTSTVAREGLTLDMLLGEYNNHLMPAVMLVTELITRAVGLEYWPYLAIIIALQAAVSVAFYRLLVLMIGKRWGLLVPLAVFLFSPLNLENSTFWWPSANVLPMQLATVVAIDAMVRYIRTNRPLHLVTLGLAMVFGLVFFEKSLLIAPLVFLVTACLYVAGGPVRSLVRTTVRYWQAWVVLTVIGVAYLILYFSRTEPALQGPTSFGEVMTFVRQTVGSTLVPGIFGGPWQWLDVGDASPLADPQEIARWLSWIALIGLVAVTVALRRFAVRAWLLLVGHVALVAGLLATTRLGLLFSDAAGLAPRYFSELVLTAALSIGVAMFGLREHAEVEHSEPAADSGRPAWLSDLAATPGVVAGISVAAIAAFVAFAVGTAYSTAGYSDDWAMKQGRDYLRTAQADLANAPEGTVFFDNAIPKGVLNPLFMPHHLQSNFFRPVKDGPVFVTESENPSYFDDAGHIHLVGVNGPSTLPGPDPGCGYKVDGGGVTRIMPLTSELFDWQWVVKVQYLSSAPATAVIRFGDAEHRYEVKPGLHDLYFVMVAGGNSVRMAVDDPGVTVCVDRVTIGNPTPRQ